MKANDKVEWKKAFAFRLSGEKLKEFRETSAEDRLNWLEEVNYFLQDFLPREKRQQWEKLVEKQGLKKPS